MSRSSAYENAQENKTYGMVRIANQRKAILNSVFLIHDYSILREGNARTAIKNRAIRSWKSSIPKRRENYENPAKNETQGTTYVLCEILVFVVGDLLL